MQRFSPDGGRGGFDVVVRDGLTRSKYVDCFNWRTSESGIVSLESQSFPYKVDDVLRFAGIVAESLVPALLVCTPDSAVGLWEHVVTKYRNGLYGLKTLQGKTINLLITDFNNGVDVVHTKHLSPTPASVLR